MARPPQSVGERRDNVPIDPFRIGVDGRLKRGFADFEMAHAAALKLKCQHPHLYVTVYDAIARHHHVVER